MNFRYVAALLLAIFAGVLAAAQPDGYEKPQHFDFVNPDYPTSQRRDNSSGVVELVFMIDKEGKPYEIMVARSSLAAFTATSLPALKKSTFIPATVNGEKVESKYVLRMNYRISSQTQAASVDFTRYYRRATKQLDGNSPDKTKVQRYMAGMQQASSKNLYALTYSGLVRYKYAKRFGTDHDKIEALKDITLFDIQEKKEQRVLSEEQSLFVMAELLKLLMKTGRYGEFLEYYEIFKTINGTIASGVLDTKKRVEQLQQSDKLISTQLTIGDQGFTAVNLFKRTFLVEAPDNAISVMKLRCDTRFLEIEFQVDAEYQLPDSWGICNLQLIGEPQTEVVLLQL